MLTTTSSYCSVSDFWPHEVANGGTTATLNIGIDILDTTTSRVAMCHSGGFRELV
jgi:hypothetical protein